MGSLTHSRCPNGRDTPHHIRCLSCRSGFFDDLLPKAVPGLDTNAGGTLCSIVPSISGHPRRRGTGSGLPDARTVSQGGADPDSSMLLTHTCSGPAARPGRSCAGNTALHIWAQPECQREPRARCRSVSHKPFEAHQTIQNQKLSRSGWHCNTYSRKFSQALEAGRLVPFNSPPPSLAASSIGLRTPISPEPPPR